MIRVNTIEIIKKLIAPLWNLKALEKSEAFFFYILKTLPDLTSNPKIKNQFIFQ